MGWFDWLRRREAESDGVRAWRAAWADAVSSPGPDVLARLDRQLEALGLPEDAVEFEREMLEGLRTLCELNQQIAALGLPTIETRHRLAGADPCHFSAPVSMPDEPSQPSGRLLLTSRRAAFAGGGGRGVAWHAVREALQVDRDVILLVRGQDQALRFRCNSFSDALGAARIARELAGRRPVE